MKRLPALLAVIALALPAAAQASSSAPCPTGAAQHCSTASRGTTQQASSLPFSGSDLLLLGGGCLVLLAAGFIARRATTLADPARRPAPAARALEPVLGLDPHRAIAPVSERRPGLVAVEARRPAGV
jgi:hypothetical protein